MDEASKKLNRILRLEQIINSRKSLKKTSENHEEIGISVHSKRLITKYVQLISKDPADKMINSKDTEDPNKSLCPKLHLEGSKLPLKRYDHFDDQHTETLSKGIKRKSSIISWQKSKAVKKNNGEKENNIRSIDSFFNVVKSISDANRKATNSCLARKTWNSSTQKGILTRPSPINNRMILKNVLDDNKSFGNKMIYETSQIQDISTE